MKLYRCGAILVAAMLAACSGKSDKVWIVVDFTDASGRPAQMAFDNPSVPDMTLADCEGSLSSAGPTLMQGILTHSPGAKFGTAKCVQSAEDPIKPKA
ncbi:hypothetical protein [Rhizobium metallidurans]|uniref:Lipoprotein n=1 Tax=Rhizobium metallidurans TaxID=1265931 RepID=A0A7W6CU36_9HYPH|nr:hypothetical protein [Rhizobium metallidurans]MBB3967185.1 hypothetical protein [Rhizobium metallidurans]